MYNLHSHGHAVGFQFLIECLNEFRVLQSFISLGTRFQILGAKYDTLSSPYVVVRGEIACRQVPVRSA